MIDAALIRRLSARTDVYVGVALRFRRSGGRDAIDRSHLLFVEIDSVDARGAHSILLLDGEEHLRERRLMAAPFHGQRMRALSPLIAEVARAELGGWAGRVVALERMRELTLEIILRVVFGARGEEAAQLRNAVQDTLGSVRSMPRMLAMALVQRDLGPRSPWGRFRIAVERFDSLLFELLARRRAAPADDSVLAMLLAQRDQDGNPPTDRQLRDQLVALLVGGVRRCAGAPFAEMQIREILRIAAHMRIRPARPDSERATQHARRRP